MIQILSMKRNVKRLSHFLFLFLLIMASPSILFSQSESEKINEKLKYWYSQDKSLSDSIRLEAGLNLMEYYMRNKPDSLFIIGREIMTAGRKKDNWLWVANAEHKIGKYYYKKGEIDSARQHYYKGMNQIEDNNHPLRIKFLSHIGRMYGKANQIDSAIFYLENAADIIEETKPESYKSYISLTVLGNLAVCYEQQGQYLEAINMYVILSDLGTPYQRIKSFENLGHLLLQLGLKDQAKAEYLKSLEIAKKSENKVLELTSIPTLINLSENLQEAELYFQKGLGLADSLNLLAHKLSILIKAINVYNEAGWLDSIPSYINQGLKLSSEINDLVNRSNILGAQAFYQVSIKEYERSLKTLRQIKPFFEKANDKLSLINIYGLMGQTFEGLGKSDSALFYVRKAQAINKQVNDQDFKNTLISNFWEVKTEQERNLLKLEKKNAEGIALLATTKTKQSYIILGLVTIFLSLIVLLYYSRYMQKKNYTIILELERSMLQKLNSKLRRFSGVITHDILSNLDLILSAGNFLAESKHQPASLTQYYNITQDTSRQLKSYCLELLEEARSTIIDRTLKDYIDPMPIVHRVLARFANELLLANVKVDLQELSPTVLPNCVVEQIFQNLVSNTLRYGATAEVPTLLIKEATGLKGGSQWIIEDNGPGIPLEKQEQIFSGLKTSKNSNNGSQEIGLTLVRSSLRDVGANLSVECPDYGGTRWVIQLP